MAAKISLGMIVRNAEATLEKCLESVAPYVDQIVIGLGGESTDATEEIARRFTDNIIPIEWHDDFAEARNIVLAACENEYYLWLDADDELIGGDRMRQLITDHPEVDCFLWPYDYARDDQGSTVVYLIRERLIKKTDEWGWVGKIHEVLRGPDDQVGRVVEDIVVKHYPQLKPATRNLNILYAQLEESEPNPDPRILVYLGTENAARGNYPEAILHLHRFVSIAGWDEEKYQAQHRIADLYRVMGNFSKSMNADFKAIQIKPEWPDAYLGLAETAYYMGRYQQTIEWTKAASTKEVPRTMLITNPRDYDFHPFVVMALALAQLGDYTNALENLQRALSVKPDPKIVEYARVFTNELQAQSLKDAFVYIWEHLCKNDEWLKARHLFDSLPKVLEQVTEIQNRHAFTLDSTAHVEDPQLMVDNYVNNPHWTPMPDEQIEDPSWLSYPRLAYALQVARSVDAKNIIDFGCSDGFITIPLANQLSDVQVTGIDLDPRCIQVAIQRVVKWKLPHTSFISANASEWKSDVEKFYDLGIAFEIIEHVVDPDAFLENLEHSARHIALTTPHLAWTLGNPPEWDADGLKGHLRIFDLPDMERMLAARGRIYNLYRQPFGDSGWIFADYRVGEEISGSRITMLAPGTAEQWSPLTLKAGGLGGSETAVIRLSEELAERGHDVTVYGNLADSGYFNRVRYRDQQHYNSSVRSDLWVAWRAPELVDEMPNTGKRLLWLHDLDVGDRLTQERAEKFDAIVAVSGWHRDHLLTVYPFLDSDRVVVSWNGVDADRFGKSVTRNPNRVIYSSSPDRGLDIILEHIWPKVVEVMPTAELHIYYGWEAFDKFLPMFPQLAEFKGRVLDLLSRSKNVTLHGRVPQDELAIEMQKAKVWLYPTYFSETFCITAVEAQLAGCIPVTNDLAALSEVVKNGVIIPGDVRDPEIIEKYVRATLQALLVDDPEVHTGIREEVLSFPDWSNIAKVWEKTWLE